VRRHLKSLTTSKPDINWVLKFEPLDILLENYFCYQFLEVDGGSKKHARRSANNNRNFSQKEFGKLTRRGSGPA
jgi:hypothetical protein